MHYRCLTFSASSCVVKQVDWWLNGCQSHLRDQAIFWRCTCARHVKHANASDKALWRPAAIDLCKADVGLECIDPHLYRSKWHNASDKDIAAAIYGQSRRT